VYLKDMNNINDILGVAPVIPVVVIESADDAVDIARALLDGGLGIVEITLRTASGLAAIENVRRSVPEMCVGAGTVWTGDDVDHAMAAGAQFLVSPGAPVKLIDAAMRSGLPYLPGVQTRSVTTGLPRPNFSPPELQAG
jgi:2-dehydro-3-deoxyphosphogluconate aldolase/(4S)-4-hydroxy-2-oxoglutarate aldolase